MQALQNEGRRRALAYVGISSSSAAHDGKPWGDWITILVQDWASTCQTVLTEPQNKVQMRSDCCTIIMQQDTQERVMAFGSLGLVRTAFKEADTEDGCAGHYCPLWQPVCHFLEGSPWGGCWQQHLYECGPKG